MESCQKIKIFHPDWAISMIFKKGKFTVQGTVKSCEKTIEKKDVNCLAYINILSSHWAGLWALWDVLLDYD